METSSFRDLYGQSLKQYEFDYPASLPVHKVLKKIANYLKDAQVEGVIDGLHTQVHPDNEDRLLTYITLSIA